MFYRPLILTFLLSWSLPACAPAVKEVPPVAAELQNTQKPPQPLAQTLPTITSTLPPPLGDPDRYPDPVALTSRVNVMVDRVQAKDFFFSLVEGTKVGMVIHPKITDEVTLSLRNVTLQEAVTAACDIYKFDCHLGKSGFRIQPRQLETRTFAIDFLPINRTGYTQIRVSSGQFSESPEGSRSNSSNTASKVIGSNLTTEYNADFWQDLENSLLAIIGTPPAKRVVNEDHTAVGGSASTQKHENNRRNIQKELIDFSIDKNTTALATLERLDAPSVTVNPQAGFAVVRAMPVEMAKVAAFLTRLGETSHRQVLLEAKIMEVELSDGYQYGIDWLAIHRGLNRFPPLVSEPAGGSTFQGSSSMPSYYNSSVPTGDDPGLIGVKQVERMPYIGDPLTNASAPGGLAAALAGGSGQAFSLALRTHDFVSFIDVLKQQGEVHVLSSPRITTTNNQKAVIKVGQDEIFFTGVKVTEKDGNGTTPGSTKTELIMTPFFSGVALDVTPQISDKGVVTLHIHPMVTEVRDKVKTFSVNGVTQAYPLAFSQSREADSIIRVMDGDVAIIGGLMKKQIREDESHLPLLGDLPWVGGVFGHTSKSWVKSELIILLRPIVIKEGDSWQEQMNVANQRVQELTHAAEATQWPLGVLPGALPLDPAKGAEPPWTPQ